MSPEQLAANTHRLLWVCLALSALATILLDRANRRRMISGYVLLGASVVTYAIAKLEDYSDVELDFFIYLSFFLVLCALARVSFLLIFIARPLGQLFRRVPVIMLELVQALFLLAALLMMLRAAGVALNSLVASSAVLTAALGFVMKDTLANLFSGLTIQAEGAFEVGDWIQYDADKAHIGRVVGTNWRSTKIITLDEALITIPNGMLVQTAFVVFTKPTGISRRNIYFTAPYAASPQLVQQIVLDALRDMPMMSPEPAPSVVTYNYNDRGVEYWLRFFITNLQVRDRIDGDARDRIWYALQRNGIPMPGLQQEIRVESRRHIEQEHQLSERRRFTALAEVDFLREMTDTALEHLASKGTTHLYGRGQYLIREGDRTSELFVLTVGTVKVMKKSGDRDVEVAELTAPAVIGEMCLLTGEPRTASVIAVEPTECLVIDKEALAPILAESPVLMQKISDVIADRRSRAPIASDIAEPSALQSSVLLGSIRRFFGIDDK